MNLYLYQMHLLNRITACDLFNEYHNKFPNFILAELNPLRSFQIVVTNMTVFGKQTLLWTYSLYGLIYQTKKGNPDFYHIALAKIIEKNKKYTSLEMILHSDQGSVYCSKRFNESLCLYNIIHSM